MFICVYYVNIIYLIDGFDRRFDRRIW